MKKLKLPFMGERSIRERFPARIENACIKSIDIDVIGHFGNAITLDMPMSLGGRLANPLSGRDLTNHVGKFIQVLFRLLALSEEDGKKLSEIKELPCRVVFCFDTIVGLGHFLDDRFMLFNDLLEILVNEGSEEEEEKKMKLKRCPICNGKAVMHERKPFYYVECSDCCLGYYSIAYDTIEGAAKEWNDRSKALAALKRKLKKEFAKKAAKLQVKSDYPLPVGKFEPYKEVTITITANSGV